MIMGSIICKKMWGFVRIRAKCLSKKVEEIKWDWVESSS
jgi:hypothetical protein